MRVDKAILHNIHWHYWETKSLSHSDLTWLSVSSGALLSHNCSLRWSQLLWVNPLVAPSTFYPLQTRAGPTSIVLPPLKRDDKTKLSRNIFMNNSIFSKPKPSWTNFIVRTKNTWKLKTCLVRCFWYFKSSQTASSYFVF